MAKPKDIYKAILSSTRLGQPVQEEYLPILTDMLADSQYALAMSKAGVKVVARTKTCRNIKMLCIEYDGKSIPITQAKLFAMGKPKKPSRAKALASMRFLVSDQITDYRQSYTAYVKTLDINTQCYQEAIRCPLSNKLLSTCKTAVDHCGNKPFIALAEAWAEANQVDLYTVALCGRGQQKVFADANLSESWQAYHRDNAVLQLTCSRANSKAGAKPH